MELISAASAIAVSKGGDTAMGALRTASKIISTVAADGSLVGYARAGHVEPMALIDIDCRSSDMLPDVLQCMQSIFAGYYLRAVSMHNISIAGASIAQRLEKFGTHRDPATAAALAMNAGMENYKDRLPSYGEKRELPQDVLEIANEALTATGGYNSNSAKISSVSQANRTVSRGDVADGGWDGKSIDLQEASSLSTGKVVNVQLSSNGHKVVVPIVIRMNCYYVETAPLLSILTFSSKNLTFSARYSKWKHGGIDFWRDLVMCQDLIDEHKKNLKLDKTGLYLQMLERRKTNEKAALVSGQPSANSASNIIVISSDTAAQYEYRTGTKLRDFNARQRFFQQGYGMLMSVVDNRKGRVRFYTRDIPEFTELSFNELKSTNKGSGPDIGDILTAFRAGSSPRL